MIENSIGSKIRRKKKLEAKTKICYINKNIFNPSKYKVRSISKTLDPLQKN